MAKTSAVSTHSEDEAAQGSQIPSLPPSGPRKLVRPSLTAGMSSRRTLSRTDAPLLSHQQLLAPAGNGHASHSHAETFYLQKQVQSQTAMVFVLEGGDRIEGSIEWYDADVIKVRQGHTRTLIYKSAIKYLHKAGETS